MDVFHIKFLFCNLPWPRLGLASSVSVCGVRCAGGHRGPAAAPVGPVWRPPAQRAAGGVRRHGSATAGPRRARLHPGPAADPLRQPWVAGWRWTGRGRAVGSEPPCDWSLSAVRPCGCTDKRLTLHRQCRPPPSRPRRSVCRRRLTRCLAGVWAPTRTRSSSPASTACSGWTRAPPRLPPTPAPCMLARGAGVTVWRAVRLLEMLELPLRRHATLFPRVDVLACWWCVTVLRLRLSINRWPVAPN